MALAMQAGDLRPKILFVDDEQRVLNSMRIMFRREYNLFLAESGRDALKVLAAEDIDVIVSDHRMPQMSGVEFLAAARKQAPRAVRILLTGYADLNAVEGSINEGEVFRFLTKPCAPDDLRHTLAVAVTIAQTTDLTNQDAGGTGELEADIEAEAKAQSAAREPKLSPEQAAATTRLQGRAPSTAEPTTQPQAREPSTAEPTARLQALPPNTADQTARLEAVPAAAGASRRRLAQGVGVIVFSSDSEVVLAVQQAIRGRIPVYTAETVVKVVSILTKHRPGVLLTDITADKATIQSMTAQLKEHLPELVTIAVSPHRDVLDMVWLINHGQIFRFMRKPLSPGRCAVCLQAALKHHRMLLKNPQLIKRHQVAKPNLSDSSAMSGVMAKLKSVGKFWGSA